MKNLNEKYNTLEDKIDNFIVWVASVGIFACLALLVLHNLGAL